MKTPIYNFLDSINHHHKDAETAHKIICPFHDDTRASAKVFPNTNTIHCFTCNRTWTVVDAYAQYHEVTIKRALQATEGFFEAGRPARLTENISVLLNPSSQDVILMSNALERTMIRLRTPKRLTDIYFKVKNNPDLDAREKMDWFTLINVKAHALFDKIS